MTDARAMLESLRPQPFGDGRPDRVVDPIVEPMWAGIRALAAVDAAGAILVDEDGVLIEDRPEIVAALAGAALGDGLVLDGFLTKQAAQEGIGIYVGTGTDSVPSIGRSVSHFFVGGRPHQAAEAAEARAELLRAATIEEDDLVAYVAFDLLWLDGESLLDVPLLERRRILDSVLAEAELVRRSTFVRPPISGWIRSWRAQGFLGFTFRAANSRYVPGVASTEWATAPMPPR